MYLHARVSFALFVPGQVLAQDRARKVSAAMAAVERLSNPAPEAPSTAQAL